MKTIYVSDVRVGDIIHKSFELVLCVRMLNTFTHINIITLNSTGHKVDRTWSINNQITKIL